jgi:hypothetical protein
MAKRLDTHLCMARKGKILHAYQWLSGVLKSGLRPEVTMLEDVPEGEDANEAEMFWIAGAKLAGCALTNRTDGGGGAKGGYAWSEEARTKLSKSLRGLKRSEQTKALMREAANSLEGRQRRVSDMQKRMANPEYREHVANIKRSTPLSAETKAKMSASWTAERKQRHAAEQRKKLFDARWSAQLTAALKKRWDAHKKLKSENTTPASSGS